MQIVPRFVIHIGAAHPLFLQFFLSFELARQECDAVFRLDRLLQGGAILARSDCTSVRTTSICARAFGERELNGVGSRRNSSEPALTG